MDISCVILLLAAMLKPVHTCTVVYYFRYLHPGSIPLAPYQGNWTYPDCVSWRDIEFIHVDFWTNDNAVCLNIAYPVYGTWFAVAYLMEDRNDEAITVSQTLLTSSWVNLA